MVLETAAVLGFLVFLVGAYTVILSTMWDTFKQRDWVSMVIGFMLLVLTTTVLVVPLVATREGY